MFRSGTLTTVFPDVAARVAGRDIALAARRGWRDPCEQGILQGKSSRGPLPKPPQTGETCLKFPIISAAKRRIGRGAVEPEQGNFRWRTRNAPRLSREESSVHGP